MSLSTYKSRKSRKSSKSSKSNNSLSRKSRKSSYMKRAISLPNNLSKILSRKTSSKSKIYTDLQIRNKFLQILTSGKNHYNYIYSLMQLVKSFNMRLNEHLTNMKPILLDDKKYYIKSNNPHNNFILFGGLLFFIIYHEALLHKIIDPKSAELRTLVSNFLKYATTDIDIIFNFNIVDENENSYDPYDEESEEKINLFSNNTKSFLKQTYKKISKEIMATDARTLKKIELILNAGKYDTYNSNNNMQDGVLKLSFHNMSTTLESDLELLRTNIETCAEQKYCDHIIDILNIFNFHDNGTFVEFKTFDNAILCQNLFIISRENIDRILRSETLNTKTSAENIKTQIRELLKTQANIKYYQGYYRVKIIYQILKNCPEELPLYQVFRVLPGYILTHIKNLNKFLRKLNIKFEDTEILLNKINARYFSNEAKKAKIYTSSAKKDDIISAYECMIKFWEIVDDELQK